MAEPEVADATRRTRLANERTYLAWLRSALTALAVAVGIGRLVPGVTEVTRWPFEVVGAGFAVLAMVLGVYGARRYVQVERALDAGRFAPFDSRAAVLVAAFATVLGIGTLVLVFVQ
jgi:putative membrane protein